MKTTLDKRGHEINDPKPLFLDVSPRPLSIKEQIQRLVRGELSSRAAEGGQETFEEANDFDVDDDFSAEEDQSPYQKMFDEVPLRPVAAAKEVKPEVKEAVEVKSETSGEAEKSEVDVAAEKKPAARKKG